MLARKLCVYNAGLKVDATQELLTVVIMKMFARVKTHKFVMHFVFGDLLCSFLASRLTTVSLDDFIIFWYRSIPCYILYD